MNLIMYNIADLSLKHRFRSYIIEVHCVLKLERLPIRNSNELTYLTLRR